MSYPPLDSNPQISGKHLLVTGVSGGLGYQTVLQAMDLGAHVIGTYRQGNARVEALSRGGMIPVRYDLAPNQENSIIPAIRQNALGGLDGILLVASAITSSAPGKEARGDIEHDVSITFGGNVELVQSLVYDPVMVSPKAVIVFASSLAATGSPHQVGYAGGKAAMDSYIWGMVRLKQFLQPFRGADGALPAELAEWANVADQGYVSLQFPTLDTDNKIGNPLYRALTHKGKKSPLAITAVQAANALLHAVAEPKDGVHAIPEGATTADITGEIDPRLLALMIFQKRVHLPKE